MPQTIGLVHGTLAATALAAAVAAAALGPAALAPPSVTAALPSASGSAGAGQQQLLRRSGQPQLQPRRRTGCSAS